MYFDETNNYFDVYKTDLDNLTNINIENISFNRASQLRTPLDGLNKGSMFSNIYSKYKNHEYNLKINNKRDELLLKIQYHNFALKDLNLYLDIYPEDTKILKEYHTIKDNLKKLKQEYEKEYELLCQNDITNKSKWVWINNPWPWDKGGSK